MQLAPKRASAVFYSIEGTPERASGLISLAGRAPDGAVNHNFFH